MEKINFKFLNFCTIYGSTGSIEKETKREYCFSTIFYQGPNKLKNDYTIEIYWDKYKDEYDNNCLLTTEQLVTHINEIKKLKSFDHTLEKHENKYVLKLHLTGPRMYHKVILSWLRYSYEWPFNVALYEAFKLKETRGFKQENLFNLFNLVGASMNYRKHGTDIHAIGEFDRFKQLINYKEFKTLVKEAYINKPKGQINYIVPVLNRYDKDWKYIEHNNKNLLSTEFWEKDFEKRLDIYKHNYKILKENK